MAGAAATDKADEQRKAERPRKALNGSAVVNGEFAGSAQAHEAPTGNGIGSAVRENGSHQHADETPGNENTNRREVQPARKRGRP